MIHRRAVLAGLAALVPARQAWAAPRFKPLFNGHDLTGWRAIGDANWSVRDGMIEADQGKLGFLVADGDYRDLLLRARFWVSPEANSGLFIRCTNRTDITLDNAYEINIFDRRPEPDYATGAIVNVAKVPSVPRTGGQWNVMEVEARGERFTVTLNGRKTVDGARDAARREGAVALQYGGGTVKFRSVEVRPL